jgi:nucleotide-binding universal stress UspA family protein
MVRNEQRSPNSVVVGTDFSEQAEIALSWAMVIARGHNTVLHLVHAVSRTLPYVDRLESFSPLARLTTERDEERLENLARKLRSPDQPIECHLVQDRPSVAILQVASRTKPGLIALGTRGEGGFSHLRLGSTAERVIQHAMCPVLTVAPECKTARRWPFRVLVATDFSLEAEAALHAAEDIVRFNERSAEILLLTVLHAPGGLEANAEVNSLWRNYVAECRKLLAERMESLKASAESTRLSTQSLLREGIPAEQIVQVALDEEVDLIAVGSRGTFSAGRAFLGSVSKRVIQTAQCPVLTVPSLLSKRMRSDARG